MSRLVETAYAKINLALHVRERLPDGYHRLETLFAFCEDGDRLEVAPSDELSLEVSGPFANALSEATDNLVLRAARELAARTETREGAAIRLDKRLPVASGIGGGSADAAAALRLLAALWELRWDEAEFSAIAAELGADVPACLRSRTVRGEGRGNRLIEVDGASLSGTPVLLLHPGVPLSTGRVFADWDGVDRGPLAADPLAGRNDLQAPALAAAPAIGPVLQFLARMPGTSLVRMSGSGATCFALFRDLESRDAAAAAALGQAPGWWRLASRLR